MNEEGRVEEEELVRAREEISHLKRRLSDERFAEELRDALTLAASAGEIASPVTHSRLLEMIVETAASVIPSGAASLFLIDEETEELIFEVALGSRAEEVRRFRVPLGHGIAGLVAVSRQPMAISDARSDPRQAADIAQSVGYEPENILCVPLFYDEDVVGVLELLDREGANSYSADMAALGLFANQAAAARAIVVDVVPNLISAARITGTPTTRGTFSFVVRATDTRGAFAERTFSITVT